MGFLLMMCWHRTVACGVFHSPLQKALVCRIPPSFTVMLCHRGAAHLPGRLHSFLLRCCTVVHRRISRHEKARLKREGGFSHRVLYRPTDCSLEQSVR